MLNKKEKIACVKNVKLKGKTGRIQVKRVNLHGLC
jgi:hypothetical protein